MGDQIQLTDCSTQGDTHARSTTLGALPLVVTARELSSHTRSFAIVFLISPVYVTGPAKIGHVGT